MPLVEPTSLPSSRDVIVIGASAGGVAALKRLCSHLPPDLPATVYVVQHIGNHPSRLAEVLDRCGPLPAVYPQDGETPSHGKIYVAPPDFHMLLQDGQIRLSRGPKENHTRPAIDPLFRSAALCYDGRVMGVVLSGFLDDGTAGLKHIKDCGGLALVQDPDDAENPGMPKSALAHVEVDHCEDAASLAARLAWLAGSMTAHIPNPDRANLVTEHLASIGEGTMVDHLQKIGSPSTLVCPDCGGTLWELADHAPPRYRCHTGHAFTLGSLAHSQASTVEEALWSAVRALQDLALMQRELAKNSHATGDSTAAARAEAEAARLSARALTIERLVEDTAAPEGWT